MEMKIFDMLIGYLNSLFCELFINFLLDRLSFSSWFMSYSGYEALSDVCIANFCSTVRLPFNSLNVIWWTGALNLNSLINQFFCLLCPHKEHFACSKVMKIFSCVLTIFLTSPIFLFFLLFLSFPFLLLSTPPLPVSSFLPSFLPLVLCPNNQHKKISHLFIMEIRFLLCLKYMDYQSFQDKVKIS